MLAHQTSLRVRSPLEKTRFLLLLQGRVDNIKSLTVPSKCAENSEVKAKNRQQNFFIYILLLVQFFQFFQGTRNQLIEHTINMMKQ
jgi:hypothetical protein